MSFARARGTITLTGVLTLPLLLVERVPFPRRDLAIYLATCGRAKCHQASPELKAIRLTGLRGAKKRCKNQAQKKPAQRSI